MGTNYKGNISVGSNNLLLIFYGGSYKVVWLSDRRFSCSGNFFYRNQVWGLRQVGLRPEGVNQGSYGAV